MPDADGTRDLGADATRFAQAYVDEVHTTGGILQTEAADHTNTPAAGKGEWWVRNDTPCVPMFTDDAGTDHVLNAGGGGGVTEKDIEDIIEGKTPAAPDTADEFLFRDVSGTDALGCATAQQIVEQGNSDLGIVPQNRISTTTDPGANDDGAGTNGINHLVNDLWTNTTDDTSWICVDTTTSAAVWKPIALTKTGTAAPAVAPDFVGQVFLDTTNENIYIGIDTVNAADFLQVNGGGAGGDLWSDVVDADIVPDADGTRDLGADATRFAQAFIDELHSTGGLLVTEAADHTNTPAAGKGEFWVRNDAPNKPIFTSDDGVDHDLTVGEWFNFHSYSPGATSGDRNAFFIVPYDCTVKEIRWAGFRFEGADASNYWTIMPKRRDPGGDVDLLDTAFSTAGGINWDLSYDMGTITTNGTDAQLSKGDVFLITYTAVGTPFDWYGADNAWLIHLEPR